MTFRVLEVSEWDQLSAIFAANNSKLPDSRFAMIIGAFDEKNTLSGFIVCQLAMHAEPLVLFKPQALSGLIHKMEEELKASGVKSYYTFVTGLSEELSKFYGLQKLPLNVYQKSLE